MNLNKIILAMTFMTACAVPSMADGVIFDPVTYPSAQATSTYTKVEAATPITPLENIEESKTRENTSLQSALYQLDSAQVDIRTQLLDAKSKYQEIDTQYRLIKEQRKAQKKEVKMAEKKIKSLEKTKNNIRKNMI